ncbi:hypothetical protein TRFO_21124 [Tritrichomonas foetus]|uniref:Uncharacterized protein n=1 Tax=Tritrichomonas foetus TaxID=1144522 RepID=A0A1J4KFQ2_9EUKA|nr:hypothetical protein TRFO_21124 [Tritrichomonas foetus]|eukprot:OHT09842.1 hypothetical protein TRFO_21124 [Tritrichomonas foetus]
MIEHTQTIAFAGGDTIDNFKRHIVIQIFFLKYPTCDVYVLKNFSFEIKPEQMGALDGHSCSGISTCAHLLE